jgi:hypothetical protein
LRGYKFLNLGKVIMKKFIVAATAAMALAGTAHADTFVNGSFENGTLSGWTQGGGFWTAAGTYPTAAQYAPGGSNYNASYIANSVTNVGFDPLTDNNLRTAYAGAHSARVNDTSSNYSVSSLSQTVKNYTDNILTFAYAAVLQSSHGSTDSDAFIISLDDLTAGDNVFSFNLNSYDSASSFTASSRGWYYTDWVSKSFDLASLGRVGHDFTLTLLANDCPYGAHAGYAYLDGFGSVVGGGGTGGAVPESSTWMMMIAGFAFAGASLRNRRRKVTVTFA